MKRRLRSGNWQRSNWTASTGDQHDRALQLQHRSPRGCPPETESYIINKRRNSTSFISVAKRCVLSSVHAWRTCQSSQLDLSILRDVSRDTNAHEAQRTWIVGDTCRSFNKTSLNTIHQIALHKAMVTNCLQAHQTQRLGWRAEWNNENPENWANFQKLTMLQKIRSEGQQRNQLITYAYQGSARAKRRNRWP